MLYKLAAGAVAVIGLCAIAQAQSVSLTYRTQTVLSLGEPVIVNLAIENHSKVPLTIDLGKSNLGHLQFRLQTPNGDTLVADPRLPRSAEEGYSYSPIEVLPSTIHVEQFILDEWFTIEDSGHYRLTIDFIGTVKDSEQNVVAMPRTGILTFLVTQRDPSTLQQTCERLTQIARTSKDSKQVRFAGKALTYVDEPVAIQYLERVIEEGKVLEISEVEFRAIKALERMASPDARDALLRVRLKSRPIAAEEADRALSRMLAGVK